MRVAVGRVGWSAAGVGVLLATAALVWRALTAGDSAELDRTLGIASVFGVAITAAGLALALFDRALSRDTVPTGPLRAVKDELARRIRVDETAALTRMLGTNRPDTLPINVAFQRDETRYRAAGGAQTGDFTDVLAYYQSLSPGRMVIVGAPGAGKTVLAVQLLVQLIEDREDGPVPVRFALAEFRIHDFEEWLVRELLARYPHTLSCQQAKELVRSREILPVLDGLDETTSAHGNSERAAYVVECLNEYLDGTARAPVVLTCRRDLDRILPEPILDATTVEIQPLGPSSIVTYLRKQFHGPVDETAWRPVTEPLTDDLEGHTTRCLSELLGTPWRLKLAVTAYQDGAHPADLLPVTVDVDATDHVARVNEWLLARYIPAATRLHRRSRRQYSPRDATKGLATVARHLAETAEWDGTDFLLHRWAYLSTGLMTKRLRAAVVSQVTAAATAFVVTTATGPFENVAQVLSDGLTWDRQSIMLVGVPLAIVVILRYTATVVLDYSFPYSLELQYQARQHQFDNMWLRMSLLQNARQSRSRHSILWCLIRPGPHAVVKMILSRILQQVRMAQHRFTDAGLWLAGTTMMGALWFWASTVDPTGLEHWRWALDTSSILTEAGTGLMLGTGLLGEPTWRAGARSIRNHVLIHAVAAAIVGFGAGLIGALGSGIGAGVAVWTGFHTHTMETDTPIIRPAAGLCAGVCAWLAFGVIDDISTGLVAGLAIAVWLAVQSESSVVACCYAGAVWTAARAGHIPWRFGPFLDWAHDAGLLRSAGGASQIRHRELQEWLTRTQAETYSADPT